MSEKKKNYSADWDWTVFFDNVVNPPMRDTVEKALEYLGPGQGRHAVDLGCGTGNDTVHILKAGFKVLAIDQSAEGLKRLQARENLLHPENLKTCKSKFESLELPSNCDFINASFALPFCPPDHLSALWQKVFDALNPGGVFAGHLFGVNDSWNNKVADMSFCSRPEVEDMIKDFSNTQFLQEDQHDGHDAHGRSKYWHVFSLVLQK